MPVSLEKQTPPTYRIKGQFEDIVIEGGIESIKHGIDSRVNDMYQIWFDDEGTPDVPLVYEGLDENRNPVWVSITTEKKGEKDRATHVTLSLMSYTENPLINPVSGKNTLMVGFTTDREGERIQNIHAGLTAYDKGGHVTLKNYPPYATSQVNMNRSTQPLPHPFATADKLLGYLEKATRISHPPIVYL